MQPRELKRRPLHICDNIAFSLCLSSRPLLPCLALPPHLQFPLLHFPLLLHILEPCDCRPTPAVAELESFIDFKKGRHESFPLSLASLHSLSLLSAQLPPLPELDLALLLFHVRCLPCTRYHRLQPRAAIVLLFLDL